MKAIAPALALAAALTAGFCALDAASAERASYANPNAWLCRPGRQDACAANQDATIVAADGKLSLEPFHADPDAPIDCFYVYPTVSRDPGGNSDLTAGPDERRAAEQQFARFGAKCRLFAPIYRQSTLKGLRAAAGPHPIPMDRELGNRDVAAAWRD